MYGGISIADRQLSGGEHLYISTDVLLSNMCTLPFARVIVAIQFISAAAATPVAHVSGDQCVTKLLFIQSAVAKTGVEEENKDLQTGGGYIYIYIYNLLRHGRGKRGAELIGIDKETCQKMPSQRVRTSEAICPVRM